MSFNTWRIISFVIIFFGIILMAGGFSRNNIFYAIFGYLGIAVFILGFIINISKSRCPHCRRYLYFRPTILIGVRYCPFCGREFD